MSSLVKRRKVDSDVPSGLLKKKDRKEKKQKIQEPAPASPSASPEPAVEPAIAVEDVAEEEVEVTKSFKDLVCLSVRIGYSLLIQARE